jgi:hypothetical protein
LCDDKTGGGGRGEQTTNIEIPKQSSKLLVCFFLAFVSCLNEIDMAILKHEPSLKRSKVNHFTARKLLLHHNNITADTPPASPSSLSLTQRFSSRQPQLILNPSQANSILSSAEPSDETPLPPFPRKTLGWSRSRHPFCVHITSE